MPVRPVLLDNHFGGYKLATKMEIQIVKMKHFAILFGKKSAKVYYGFVVIVRFEGTKAEKLETYMKNLLSYTICNRGITHSVKERPRNARKYKKKA